MKTFLITATVVACPFAMYGLSVYDSGQSVPSNYASVASDVAMATSSIGQEITVERTFEVKERVRDGSGALEQHLAQFIVITSTSDEVTIKKIVLNRGNCNGRVSDAITYLGYTNEPIEAPSYFKTEKDIQYWKEAYSQTPSISLKFGEQVRVEPECKKVIEASITTSDDQVRVYTFPN
jgi:hypothetical protein